MPGFRINRKKVGLTYSCPTTCEDNPIECSEHLAEFLESKGACDYIVCEEKHENGTRHYHALVNYVEKLDTTNERFFDLCTVHPNILNPGKGWREYVLKQGDWISNYYGKCPWHTALKLDTPEEAIEYLWQTVPEKMCLHAHNIEANLKKRKRQQFDPVTYEGPYSNWIPPDWHPKTHSLLISGPPGVNKTQYARYILNHMYGSYDYIKGTLQSLKDCKWDKPLLFDEIHMLDHDPEQSKEITDVENGGTIKMRYGDVVIPPGVPRIFVHNMTRPFRNPHEAVYNRRLITSDLHSIFSEEVS
jgi:hypothetical protein